MQKIMYCHGRGSCGNGTKAKFLKSFEGYEVIANDYPTNDPINSYGEMDGELKDMSNFWRYVQILSGDIKVHQPDIIVASSFGGAVLLRVILERNWTGPSIFLAQAGVKFGVSTVFPSDTKAIFIHGTFDDVVPIEGSRLLASTSQNADLIEVQDGHRLHRNCSKDAMKIAIEKLLV